MCVCVSESGGEMEIEHSLQMLLLQLPEVALYSVFKCIIFLEQHVIWFIQCKVS